MSRGNKPGGGRPCRYQYDQWIGVDGRLYVKVAAIEFERATIESFTLNAQRRARARLALLGVDRMTVSKDRTNWLEVWDIARDYASDMPEAYTFRTQLPLPAEALSETAA